MSIIPNIFERKIREYTSLASIKTENKQPLRYKERESLVLHIEQVSKNLGEHGRLLILVETFTGQVVDGGIPISRDYIHGQLLRHTSSRDLVAGS